MDCKIELTYNCSSPQKFSNETTDAIAAAVDQRIEARIQSEQENKLDDERVRSYIIPLVGGDGVNENNQTNNGNKNPNTSSM